MAAPTLTLSPTFGPAGTLVTVTATRGNPPVAVEVTATTDAGVGTASFDIVESLTVAAGGRAVTVVSDDQSVVQATFVA